MGTILGFPGPPLVFDNGLLLDDSDFTLPTLDELQRMTANEEVNGDAGLYGQDLLGQTLLSPGPVFDESFPPANTSFVAGNTSGASDASRSPGCMAVGSHLFNSQSNVRHANRVDDVTASGSSLSPGSDPMILTPTSTLEYTASNSNRADEDANDLDPNISPTSTNRTDSEYVFISSYNSTRTAGRLIARQTAPGDGNLAPPSSLEASGGSDVQRASRASSLASSIMSYSSGGAAHWGSMSDSSPSVAYDLFNHGEDHPADSFAAFTSGSFNQPTPASTGGQYDNESLADFDRFRDDANFNGNLPYRTSATHYGSIQNPYTASPSLIRDYAQHQHQHQLFQQHHGRSTTFAPHLHFQTQPVVRNVPSAGSTFRQLQIPATGSNDLQQQASWSTATVDDSQVHIKLEPQHTVAPTPRRLMATIPSTNTHSPPHRAVSAAQSFSSNTSRQLQGPAPSSFVRPLASAPQHHPTYRQSRPSHGGRSGRGGRPKDSHLTEGARKKSHAMRKIAACWRCALQRDPCDDGSPCSRCRTRFEKGQVLYFGCDRSKLPDFVHDFLPPQASMTLMHQKQTIEDTVKDQVLQWDHLNPIDVYLSSGYGPPLRWKLHEFEPRTDDLLGQFQYMQDPNTGRLIRYHKYSPPFGLMKLDASDDSHFDEYLDTLLLDRHLKDLGWTCFEEESQVDDDQFQARLLDQMCVLYVRTGDPEVKHLMRDILKMMIITYIMGHTLTICEETLPTVLNHVKFSRPGQQQKHTSPRLANRQLKFYFAVMRSSIYEKILKWQQQILHTSGKKDESWLTSFCAMLGFAMVLEEVQRTLQIQADAKIAKDEMPHDQAETEARNACERIDDRFQLLVGLFQCKYRDRKWGDNGSFGPSTPQFTELATISFLYNVRQLLDQKRYHLEHRRNVQYSRESSCQYTSRLVARFLLPFLGLPRE